MFYTLLSSGYVLRSTDNAQIPNDPGNADWQAYLLWVRQGNVAQPVKHILTTGDVDEYRDKRLAAGYSDSASGKIFKCDAESRGFWTALGTAAGFGPRAGLTLFQLITADNTILSLNSNDTFDLINSRILPWVSAVVLYARTLKDNILAGNPPTDITVGWP